MSDVYWNIYKVFNNPPGTPKELKCVPCKIAAGGGSLMLGTVSLALMKKNFIKNQYKAVALGLAAFCFTATSVVTFRLAYDHDQYNKNLIKNHAELIRLQRKEVRESQQASPSLQGSS